MLTPAVDGDRQLQPGVFAPIHAPSMTTQSDRPTS
jgi:hypothetical protein